MARLCLNLLGTVQVTLDGAPITDFESDKVRALLVYLAVESDRPQRRETLAGLLWPDVAERDARTNLRHVLANLRKALGDRESARPFLLINRQTLQFNTASDYQLDARTFSDAITATSAHAHPKLEDCETCMTRLSEAAKLYTGDFLAGFSLPSDLFEEWVVVQREKLHIQALDVLDHLAAHHENNGDYSAAQRYAQRQVELELWLESAHRQVMRTLTRSGQRGMALAQYETCRRILEAELGIEPETETTTLYEQIRRGELQQIRSEPDTKPIPESIPTPAVPHNLPTSLTPFVGRGKLLEEIETRLVDPDCRLLTLVGPGGSGKTRLVLETARQIMEGTDQTRFPDGFFFTPLAAIGTADGLVPAIAQAIGFSFYGEGEPQAQLLGYLKRKKLLLILDNYEHLVEDVGIVVEILHAAPGVNVLVTSRVKLNLPAEQLMPIPGMAYPSSTSEQISQPQHSAVKLFIQCAQRVKPDFALDEENTADMIRICQLVQGMPLGIQLATAWIHVLTPAEIADEIERSLDFLDVDWQEVPARQRSMRAVFDHSWHLLNAREREILCGLSVFRGGCTREAAHAVTGASLRDLLGLINKSLLYRTPDERYEMHELMRQYAAERLAQQPDNERLAYERHYAFYAENLARWEGEQKGPRQLAAIAELTVDLENARLAIDWMLEKESLAGVEQSMDCLGIYFWEMNRFEDGASVFKTFSEKLLLCTAEFSKISRAQALAWQAGLTEQTGNIESAIQLIKESLSILGISEVMRGEFRDPVLPTSELVQRVTAFALYVAGMANFQKDMLRARWLFEQSQIVCCKLGNQWGATRALFAIANTYNLAGDQKKAIQLSQEVLLAYKVLGDTNALVHTSLRLGRILINSSRVEEGEKFIKQALKKADETGIKPDLTAFRDLSVAQLCKGEFHKAMQGLEREITRFDELGIKMRTIECTFSLTVAYLHLGHYDHATQLAKQMYDQCLESGYTLYLSGRYTLLGRIALGRGNYQDALQYFEQRNQGRQPGETDALVMGYALRGLGQHQNAQGLFHRVLQKVIDQNDSIDFFQILCGVALIFSDLGQIARAVELYALATRYPFVGNSQWFEDVVGKHIEKAAESLPSDVVEAAKERGRALDLWATAEALLVELEANGDIA